MLSIPLGKDEYTDILIDTLSSPGDVNKIINWE